MRMTIVLCVLASVLLVLAPTSGKAQSCMPVDSTLAMPLVDIKELVVSTDPVDVADRQQLAIPAIDSAQVTVLSDTKICDKVLAAFKSSLSAGVPLPTTLFVMKVGTVYVALYRESAGEADMYRVVSKQYAILSRFVR